MFSHSQVFVYYLYCVKVFIIIYQTCNLDSQVVGAVKWSFLVMSMFSMSLAYPSSHVFTFKDEL